VTEQIRVFLCDDVAELRALMRFSLEEEPGLVVIGEAPDGLSGAEQIADLQPDVVLLDLSMPGLDGLEAIPRIKEVSPATGIVIFSGFSAERMSGPAIALGADRYVEKGEPVENVREIVRDVGASRRRTV
jgi:DNA-binding NarL/FixJ family response regulator